jgi:hypothetical protein
MPRNYDEDRELTRYVWENFRHLMTAFEIRCNFACMLKEKATHSESNSLGNLAGKIDVDVKRELEAGVDAFRRRVRERLLRDCGTEMPINRCAACGRIVATAKAQQCLWCGHDWHSRKG